MEIQNLNTLLAELFKVIGQPARIEILRAIGRGEACVCHLEAQLNMRQAYISQHLMALRQANVLDTRRDGRYIYYSLANPAVLDLVYQAAQLLGIPDEIFGQKYTEQSVEGCACPHCDPQSINLLTGIDA